MPGRISGAQEKDGTLVLVVDLYSPQGKVYNTSVLTIQLQQAESEKEENENILSSLEGWKYLSIQLSTTATRSRTTGIKRTGSA